MFKMNFEGISKFVVYGDGVVLFEKTRDLSAVGTLRDGGGVTSGSDKLVSFNLSDMPKNARKVNLNRKDNYFVKYTCDYWPEKKTALYVHVSEVDVVNLGEYLAMDTSGEKSYMYAYKVTFKHGAVVRTLHAERLLVPGSWTIPEVERAAGAHWKNRLGDYNNSYETVSAEELKHVNEWRRRKGYPEENYNLIHWYYTTDDAATNYYNGDYYHRTEKDAGRLEREKIADVLSKALGHNPDISHYDVERLLKVVNITLK